MSQMSFQVGNRIEDFELQTLEGKVWRLSDQESAWRLFVFHRHLG